MIREVTIDIPGQGLHAVTETVAAVVREAGVSEGLCTLFIRHTSASAPGRGSTCGSIAAPAPGASC